MRRIVFLCLLLVTLAGAQCPTPTKLDAAKQRGPVAFDHARHSQTLVPSCDVCHHTQAARKCSDCHLGPNARGPSLHEPNFFENPMHIRCYGCHSEDKKGPTACTGCHEN